MPLKSVYDYNSVLGFCISFLLWSFITFSTDFLYIYLQKFSERACAHPRTRKGAAIFVQIVAGKCSEMCVRVHACTPFKCVSVRQLCRCTPYVRALIFCKKKSKKFLDKKKLKRKFFWSFFEKMCGCACGGKKLCAGACVAHYNFCNVHAGAG